MIDEFTRYRPLLFSIVYRMTGSASSGPASRPVAEAEGGAGGHKGAAIPAALASIPNQIYADGLRSGRRARRACKFSSGTRHTFQARPVTSSSRII